MIANCWITVQGFQSCYKCMIEGLILWLILSSTDTAFFSWLSCHLMFLKLIISVIVKITESRSIMIKKKNLEHTQKFWNTFRNFEGIVTHFSFQEWHLLLRLSPGSWIDHLYITYISFRHMSSTSRRHFAYWEHYFLSFDVTSSFCWSVIKFFVVQDTIDHYSAVSWREN